jgi:antitoxin PrlF
MEETARREPVSFTGAVTTTGRSEALRLEKSFFRANPEFRQRAKVRAHVIGPGHVLVTVDDTPASADEAVDPVVTAYLAFLERDMAEHPERLTPFSLEELEGLAALLEGVSATDDDRLPEDVTF